MMNIDSKIFDSLDEINFIITQLKDQQKFKNRKITLNPLYKATNDGKNGNSGDFHEKCRKYVQQLIFIKTVKGEIFGGYTEIGFRSREGKYEDEKAFLFSLTNKKIYKAKKGKNIVYDFREYGPSFYSAFYIKTNMFYDGGYLEPKSTCDERYKGFSYDYEINNGEKNFFIQEIEVYQILFNKN